MIKFLTIGLSILTMSSFAQPINYTTIVSYRNNGFIGQDATVWHTADGTGTRDCTPSGLTTSPAATNYGNDVVGGFSAWTWNAAGCPTGATRFYIRFPQLSILGVGPYNSAVPAVTINSAVLILHGIDQNNANGIYGNNLYPGTPLPFQNDGLIFKIAAGANNASSPNNWKENTITWNSAQNINTDANISPVAIPVTNAQYGGEQHIDVTDMVARIVRDAAGYFNTSTLTTVQPDVFANNGFLLQLQNETPYRSQAYATSDHPDPEFWPELVVSYSSYGNCDHGTDLTFNYTNNLNNNPLDFYFWANTQTFPGGTPVGYEWYVNAPPNGPAPGATPVGTSADLFYNFPLPGEYVVTMLTYFCQDVVSKSVHITVDGNTGDVTQTPQKAGNATSGNIIPNEEPNSDGLIHHVMPPDEPDLSLLSKNQIVSVNPNPTESEWTINLNMEKPGSVDLVLYDAFGKKIAAETKSLQSGTNTFKLPATNLLPGLYVLELKGEALNYREKLVKK